ncbi:MAG: aspartate carbamoyltransferase [Deltaproteobacteria bacterium GWF2_42_12]|nr:MAG: aspartate carbamoyltransferase [Deltaproteobacteria bacterium GWD2_42_10]OGP45876.1 MAG: aspartate carbamoyltransferase [Deltaproteobacteria bacterium GWF2_42_12]OGQ28749.1 MAG: aspartate carbamoyltransferase [Deltaproteobacteria bacterium RIFCSPHIGHO2_02_FULL_42_44]OGQ38529.1 MAG: aspartate carbamoyltransferase [Deltaproteobacteria bacterium RIFCSPLOWO2_02_FULL_42_39]OGQ65082.1 MAG: aspartate carbamoyltransferase [Deltaproteobacteria bacterium RIFCSPLOWO2_12_FULL_42_16]OGQ74720.1 MAG:
MRLKRKDILSIEELSKDEIELILSTAESFKEVSERDIKKVPTLRGRTIINLFYEASTRTRTSFEIAAKRMSADAINISTSSSSVVKGETLKDTAKNLEAMNPDCIVLRHPSSGAPEILAKYVKCSVINAGDGSHEHPSQALLDMLTVKERFGKIEGLNITIVGDIAHSRVARSNIYGFTKLGAKVTVVGPPTMMPSGIENIGCSVSNRIEDAISNADVIMMLRIQLERHEVPLFPTIREYSRLFGLDSKKLETAKKDVVILHPGPINRGVEISPEIADGPYSLILDQVKNGVAVRMALFYLLLGGSRE